MAQKPFREKAAGVRPAADDNGGDDGGDKDDFEEKVLQDFNHFKVIVDQLKQKTETGKVEKDEAADKFSRDKFNKDQKEQKHEKFEKEHRDITKGIIKEGDVVLDPTFGVLPAASQADPQLLARIAALEDAVGKLLHFIPAESRPDLSKGALKDEPDTPPKDSPPAPRRRRR
ncbi:MAG TPA: hypothetical protein VM689_11595 [Aliidongia sp.]|nr:hypothetical protein [Aliidongia sp.]